MIDIVYVDDTLNNIYLMEAIAENKLNMSIHSYIYPEDAIGAIDEDLPKIVILDFHMPVYNGVECIHRMRELSPHSKFIMLTAYCTTNVKKLADDAEFDAFLCKPLNINHLKETIDNLLEKG